MSTPSPVRSLCGLLGLLMVASSPAWADWPPDATSGIPFWATTDYIKENPRMISDGNGGAIVVWEDHRYDDLPCCYADLFAQHVLEDGSIDPAWPVGGLPIAVAWNDQVEVTLISDGSGGALLVWRDRRGLTWDIYAHHLLANGILDPAWPANGLGVCTTDFTQEEMTACSDGMGGMYVAWRERGFDRDDIYAQHVLATGTLDPVWPVGGLAVCTAPSMQGSATAVPDGSGGAFLFWHDQRPGTHSDIYGHHLLPDGQPDPVWPANGLLIGGGTGDQVYPRSVDDGEGAAIVAWSDSRNAATQTDIYSQRVLSAGTVDPVWPSNGSLLSGGPEAVKLQAMVTDGAGGAVAAWIQEPLGLPDYDYDIYTQRVRADGQLEESWPVNGRALCTSPGTQVMLSTMMIPDSTGGAFVCWDDAREVPDFDVYVQHVLGVGAVDPAWPTDGRAVASSQDEQVLPTLVSDGRGGCLVGWQSYNASTGMQGIYGQRVRPDGELGDDVVGITRPSSWALRLDSVHPNPVRHGAVQVGFALPGETSGSLEIVDLTGRRVAGRDWRTTMPGRHVATFDVRDVRSGVYFVRLTQDGHSSARRIAIVK